MFEVLLTISVSIAAIIGWLTGLLGLPGNWVMVAVAAACWGLASPDSMVSITALPLVCLVVLAALGELFEFLAGALGVKKLGGSNRSTWLALGAQSLAPC